jgi:LPXTG-motif cell wall-anchored protein
MTVDGKPVTVADLKPGMKGTATITTTTTTTPVTVTEVRNAEVARVSGNSIIVRGQNGFRMFSEADVSNRDVRIYRDGQPIAFRDLRQGDRLTATIVTSKPPRVMTQRQVEAELTGAPAAAASPTRPPAPTAGTAGAAPAPPAPAAPSPSAAATPAKRLPKTASPIPLLGLLGAGSLLLGTIMAIRRRRHSA